LTDQGLFHRLSLIRFLARVGLGADGLSSSSYGPEEAFRTLGDQTYLAVGLAFLTAFTVLLISAAYRRIIEDFPHGGGGYVVATKLLGERFGVVSGCALLVDYVLTIGVSIASAGDALFSFIPPSWQGAKLTSEFFFILGLTVLNIRGVRESVTALLPIFIVFLITHALAIFGGIIAHAPELLGTARAVGSGFAQGVATHGVGGVFLLFLHAYSMGGGIDSGSFKGEGSVDQLRELTEETLKKYLELADRLGLPATYRFAIGSDAVEEAEKLCLQVAEEFPHVTFFGGKIVFHREGWYQRLLHNETARALQNRLFWAGKAMVILPAKV
jgi:amino acid transporter